MTEAPDDANLVAADLMRAAVRMRRAPGDFIVSAVLGLMLSQERREPGVLVTNGPRARVQAFADANGLKMVIEEGRGDYPALIKLCRITKPQ